MAVQIKLRRRYLSGFRSTNRGGEKAAPRKNRNKLGAAARAALPAQPNRALLVDGRTGKSRMITL